MQFKWYQNPNTITITFQVPANTQKAGIDVQCNGTTIKGGSKGGPSLCEGILYSQVKLPFKWDISSGKVIVSLEKVNKVRWPQIFDGKKRVKAQYDYDAQDAEELNFKENDILIVLKEDPTGWWKGELNGQVGTFPVNFVEPIPDVVAPPESPEPPTSTPQPAPTPAPVATEPEPVENPESEESQSFRVAMPGMTASADGTDAMAELKNRLQKRNPGQGPQIDELVKNRKQENQPPPEFPNKDQLKKRAPEKSTDAPPPSTGPAPVKLPIATKTGGVPLPAVKKAPIKSEVAPPVKNDAPAKQPSKVSSFPVKKTEEAEKSSFLRKSEADAEPEPPTSTPQPAPTLGPSKKVALTKPPKPAPHKQIKVRAAFQYDVQEEGELGFLVGDIIEIKTKSDSGWWQGELNGLVGWFPATFVEDYVEAPEREEPKPTENSTETSKNSSSDEDVGSKLSEIVSDAPRLAAPKRAGGASGRCPIET